MKKQLAVLALSCLCLTACGGQNAPPADAPARPATVLETASGLTEEEILLTIDGREVPAWRYLYWLAYTCDRLAERYAQSALPLDWSAPVPGGTLADYAKDQALANTALYTVVENWADAYGCTLPENQDSSEPALPALGLSDTQLRQLEDVGRRYAALYDLYHTQGSALAPTAEDLAAYGEESGAMTLDRILVSGGDDREAARQRISELFSQLNSAEDQAAAFSNLAAAGDDTAGPRTVLPETSPLDETLLAAAKTMAEGQCSGILESEEGFSILRRLPLDTAALMDSCFDALLESAAQQAQVAASPAYEALDAAAFYDAFQQARRSGSGT